jgi:outer membrane phospholipase A
MILRHSLFLLALACPLAAQPVALSLVPTDHALAAGSAASVDLVFLNRGTTTQPFIPPPSLVAELQLGAQSQRLELSLAAGSPGQSDAVAPGGFAVRSYTFTVPAGAGGRGIIEVRLAGFAPVRAVIDFQDGTGGPVPAPAASLPGDAASKPPTSLARTVPAASAIQRTFANRLGPHEPIYFIYGADAPAAKFQFSFKYRLLNFTEVSRERMSRTLQFGFTQRSLWDVTGVSSPFYDTSYMPEIIFESLAAEPDAGDRFVTWLGYQAALKHESNGRDGPVSRSLNTVYFRPAFAFGQLEGWHLIVLPEVFAYVSSLDNNPGLKDYRGYGQLRMVLGRNDGPSLLLSTWAGRDFEHPTVQFDLTFPVRTKLLNFATYLLVQYFNGYGESLLSYREKTSAVRAGFSFVR